MYFRTLQRNLPSRTSAETNMIRPEQTYCGTEYGMKKLKLSRMPTHTINSDANKICLQPETSAKI